MRRRSPPRRRRAGEEEDAHPSPDRLSALPDALLRRVMSSHKAWEVVRTCVLSRRWRHLWASAPCVDLRLRPGCPDGDTTPEEFARFARSLFRRRDASAPVDTLRLRSSDVDGAFDEDDAKSWIRTAVKRRARVIHLIGHRDGLAALEHAAFVSRHLRILKLSYARLDDNLLTQLSSRCPSLEEMDLKDCLISGSEISSSSLKTLAMVKCNMFWGLTITAPNLVLLRCVKPIGQAPSFNNLGSIVAGTIILDDYCFSDDFEDFSKDGLDETTDDDSDDGNKWRPKTGAGYGFGLPQKRHRPSGYKDAIDYGSDIESDDNQANTYEYSEIASDFDGSGYNDVGHSSTKDGNLWAHGENSGCSDSKISGGHNIIHSLSNATSLELLADAGEVILTRELKSCPSFSNLKTLCLGEWSMAADFDRLLLFLQCSPNLEKLFLELKLSFNVRKAMELGVKPNGRSFACKHLRMVKIKCSKDDVRVHKLARLFKANGVSVEKIFVRRTGSTYLRGKKTMKDLARHELEFWGDKFWGDG
ncbi:putative F-box/FBD/LRR-repeat protein At5g22610 [Miscanthus floridulus]|uniref:putative F-box/FBD/LRR-repeat protein At5g22610 n=1 Tax=Miscanthus floridulus TaxID=154761 RepID=UPI0034587BC6